MLDKHITHSRSSNVTTTKLYYVILLLFIFTLNASGYKYGNRSPPNLLERNIFVRKSWIEKRRYVTAEKLKIRAPVADYKDIFLNKLRKIYRNVRKKRQVEPFLREKRFSNPQISEDSNVGSRLSNSDLIPPTLPTEFERNFSIEQSTPRYVFPENNASYQHPFENDQDNNSNLTLLLTRFNYLGNFSEGYPISSRNVPGRRNRLISETQPNTFTGLTTNRTLLIPEEGTVQTGNRRVPSPQTTGNQLQDEETTTTAYRIITNAETEASSFSLSTRFLIETVADEETTTTAYRTNTKAETKTSSFTLSTRLLIESNQATTSEANENLTQIYTFAFGNHSTVSSSTTSVSSQRRWVVLFLAIFIPVLFVLAVMTAALYHQWHKMCTRNRIIDVEMQSEENGQSPQQRGHASGSSEISLNAIRNKLSGSRSGQAWDDS